MDWFEKFRLECQSIVPEAKLEEPPKTVGADLAAPCFFSENPIEKAKTLAKTKFNRKSLIEKIEAKGPYVNFFINWSIFTPKVITSAINPKYGKGKRKQKIVLEHTSINPTGPVHVGRLRNSVIGDTLARLLKFFGHEVETHYYVNDIGKQVALIVWGVNNKIKPKTELIKKYKQYANKPDFKTMFIYVSAYEKFSEIEVEKILDESETNIKRMQKIAKQCLEGQKESLQRLGITFDFFDFESKYILNKDIQRILNKLRKKNVLIKKDGALGLDLSKYGYKRRGGLCVLVRSNKTSVYILRDLAYHLEKEKQGNIILNVLGEDHKLEFQELRTILTKFLDFKANLEVVHYAFVNFSGRLSTRRGQTAPLDMLIDEGVSKVLEKVNDIKNAEKITKAAIRYHMIKTDLNTQINFVWNDVLRSEGNTGPYLQYTYTRLCSVLKKSQKKPIFENLENLQKERALIKQISLFPTIIRVSATQRKPNILANYLYKLASTFNEYYHVERIIGSGNECQKLALLTALRNTLKNGLWILGIDPMESM